MIRHHPALPSSARMKPEKMKASPGVQLELNQATRHLTGRVELEEVEEEEVVEELNLIQLTASLLALMQNYFYKSFWM